MTAVEIASHFSTQFRKKFGAEIDEMKLHKMLYLAQRESLIRMGRPLFSENILAWKYGPVVVEVRRAYHSGSIPKSLMTDGVPHAELDILDYVFNTYAEKNSWSLSRLTHAEYSWQHAREADPIENGDCVMPIADISLDARRVASRRAAIKALGLA